MVVKGFQLPAAFVSLVNDGGLSPDHWRDRELIDAYGNLWDGQLEAFPSVSWIESENQHLEDFATDPDEAPPGPPEHCPGFIRYINDFSQIVCFAQGHEGNPYCFDFRQNPGRPSIIYWDDVYWRRVAPDFETLLALYDPERPDLPGSGGSETEPDLPTWKAPTPIPEPARTEAYGRLKEAMRTMYGRELHQWMEAELRRLEAERGNQEG